MNVLSTPAPGSADCATPRIEPGSATALLDQWRHVAAEVVHLQQQYIEIDSVSDGTPPEWRAAWLRLWQAEQHLREIEYALEHQSL